jgi:hypothetical protein
MLFLYALTVYLPVITRKATLFVDRSHCSARELEVFLDTKPAR